jgi:hypothetical protein
LTNWLHHQLMEKEQTLNLADYVIQFASVFKIKEVGTAFYEFLKKEFNSDNWDFIQQLQTLDKLTQKKNTKKVLHQVHLICKLFIEKNSQKELSAEKQKEEILTQISKLSKNVWDLKISPKQLFEPLERIILMEYKNDAFKRFVRTPECLALVEKYKNNQNMLTPLLSQVYNYKDEDFQRKPFSDKEKAFIEQIQTDNPNWILFYQDNKTHTLGLFSLWNYFPSLSYMSDACGNGKIEILFDYPLQAVAIACFNNYHKNDPSLTHLNVVEYKHNEYVLIDEHVKFSFFADPRIKRNYQSVHYDPELKKISLITKPCQIDLIPMLKLEEMEIISKQGEKPKKIKAVQYFTYYATTLTAIGDKTLFQQVSMVDLGTKSSDGAAVFTKLIQGFQTNISKALKTMTKETKISDFKYQLNQLWEGKPVQPIGKLLVDLDIDSIDKEYEEKMQKRKNVFNISNFILHFSSLKRKEISKKYYEFLKSEHNSDSWDFILDVNSLRNLHEKRKFQEEQETLEHILNQYIHDKSPKDLSINKELKSELMQSLDSRIKGYPIFKYFDKIYQKIKLEHQLDSFKRFGKSSIAKDVLAKYQHDIEVMTPILQTSYKDEDFKTQSLSKKDFEFSHSIVEQSSTWDSLQSQKNVKVSLSKVNWYPEVSFIDSTCISFQFEFSFDFPLEQVANAYFSLPKMNKVDPNISKSKLISYNADDEFESSIFETEMIWMLNKPLTKKNVCGFISNGRTIRYISKPIMETKLFQYEIISLVESNSKTKFQHIISFHSKENIDWTKCALERGNTFYFSMIDSIAKSEMKINYCEEIYTSKDSSGLPKDALGMMLFHQQSKDFGSFIFGNDTTSDDAPTESFIDLETEPDLLTDEGFDLEE